MVPRHDSGTQDKYNMKKKRGKKQHPKQQTKKNTIKKINREHFDMSVSSESRSLLVYIQISFKSK